MQQFMLTSMLFSQVLSKVASLVVASLLLCIDAVMLLNVSVCLEDIRSTAANDDRRRAMIATIYTVLPCAAHLYLGHSYSYSGHRWSHWCYRRWIVMMFLEFKTQVIGEHTGTTGPMRESGSLSPVGAT